MQTLSVIIICLCLIGCASSPIIIDDSIRNEAGGLNLRTATSWDTSFVHSEDLETGIILEFFFNPLTLKYFPFTMPSDTVRTWMAQYTFRLWRYPIDTVLRKGGQKEGLMIGGSISEYFYDINNDPLIFHGMKMSVDPQAALPIRVDSTNERYFFRVPPGRYVFWMYEGYFTPEPGRIKDVVVQKGKFSVIKITLGSQTIY